MRIYRARADISVPGENGENYHILKGQVFFVDRKIDLPDYPYTHTTFAWEELKLRSNDESKPVFKRVVKDE